MRLVVRDQIASPVDGRMLMPGTPLSLEESKIIREDHQELLNRCVQVHPAAHADMFPDEGKAAPAPSVAVPAPKKDGFSLA